MPTICPCNRTALTAARTTRFSKQAGRGATVLSCSLSGAVSPLLLCATRSSPAPEPASLSQYASCRRCRQRSFPLRPLGVEATFGGPSGQPSDRPEGRTYAQDKTPRTMPTGIAATRAARQRERRSRTAVGATAGRSQRAGTNRSAGHRRRAQTTIRSASRLSIAALSPPGIAQGYVRAASAAKAADRRPPRAFPRAASLLLRTIRACAARSEPAARRLVYE